MVEQGARWAVEREYGFLEDLQFTEANGFLSLANADAVSKRVLRTRKESARYARLRKSLLRGPSGRSDSVSGSCRGELTEGQICVMIHSGSRGFGYQVCDEHVKTCSRVGKRCRSRKGAAFSGDLEKQGIFVRAEGRRTLHEEVA